MRHSRSIGDLRADVAANCRTLLALAGREGLSVLVTETVRDAEYQRMLAEKGYAARGAVTPSFHADHAGLAFDICKNEAGHEYDDPAFLSGSAGSGKRSDFPGAGTGRAFPTGRIFSGMRAERTRARWSARSAIRRPCRAMRRKR